MQTAVQNIAPSSHIAGLRECDAEFYGRWLIMAGRAERHWKKLLAKPKFSRRVEHLTIPYFPNFEIAATAMLSGILANRTVAVNLWDEMGTEFTMMVHMGFFKVHRGLYQLNIPKTVKVETVRSAAIELLGTEDRHYHLHPEILVEIKAHQKNAADKRQVGGCYF
jgi:hypothetical protein